MDFWQANLRTLTDVIFSQTGVVAIFLVILSAFCAHINRHFFVCSFAILLVASMSSPFADSGVGHGEYVPISQPFEWLRDNCRVITAAMIIVLLPTSILSQRQAEQRSVGTILFLSWHLFYITLLCIGQLGDIAKNLVSALVIIAEWIILNRTTVRSTEEWFILWKPFIYGGIIFIGINFILVAIHSPGLGEKSRFQGFTANPQFMSENTGLVVVILAASIADPYLRKACKIPKSIAWVGCCLGLGFMAWTGSRSPALTTCAGLIALFGRRIGRAGLFLIPAIIGAFIVVNYFSGTEKSSIFDSMSRLINSENTRSGVWGQLWNDFSASPVFGRGNEMESKFSESSYLFVAARLGLVGVLPLLGSIFLIGVVVFRASRLSAREDEIGISRNLPFALFVTIAMGACAEVYLVGQFHFFVVTLLFVADAAVMKSRLFSSRSNTDTELFDQFNRHELSLAYNYTDRA